VYANSIFHFSVADAAEKQAAKGRPYVMMPFYRGGAPLEGSGIPRWGMSLCAAGSMRFRWNEQNPVREAFLRDMFTVIGLTPVYLELVHSQTICTVQVAADVSLQKGDGMIMRDKSFVPVVTVADCMPIFLFDPVTGVFGALHSGWKGTGIVAQALQQAHDTFGTDSANVCVVMGPHIHQCCYTVDEERARYFNERFGSGCAVPAAAPGTFSLSLEQANLHILEQAGVPAENIAVSSDCTCCNPLFGSFRREAAGQNKPFTVQAAFCGYF